MPRLIFRFLEVTVVAAAVAVLAVRGIEGDAYREYRRRGGRNGFLEWFAKEVCGAEIPGVTDRDAEYEREREEKERERAERQLERERKEAEDRAKRLEEQKALAKRMEKERKAKAAKASAKRRPQTGKGRGRGGAVKVGGRSSYVAGSDRTPYRVNGIRGIEFGSSDNAPGENVRPTMSVRQLEDGSMEFVGLRWSENKALTEPIYGFEKAWLNHSYETEQLSSVTMNRSFPFTREGMAQAVEFYRSMSAEASADLGFEVVDVDRTGTSNATVCEFRNRDGDTTIRGAINTWNDKSITVTLSVSDKQFSAESRAQSQASYESGVADAVDARIEVVGKDYSRQMQRAVEYLEQ